MRFRVLYYLIILFSCVSFYNAQGRKYLSHQIKNNVLLIRTDKDEIRLVFYSDEIIEATYLPSGTLYNPVSHAHEKIQPLKLNIVKRENGINIKALSDTGITAKISFQPFRIDYFLKDQLLFSDVEGYRHVSGQYADEVLTLQISENEKLMGGGARALGMNRRGNRLQLYNKAHYGYEERSEMMNYTMPIVLSSKKYLLHFDNAQSGYLDLDSKKQNKISFESIGGQMTYQVVAGDSWKNILKAFTNKVTGNQPLPPAWAFGNFASRFGYHSQKQTMNVVNGFDKDSIPLDAIILDLYWFGKEIKGTLGNFEFFKDSFPDPNKMIHDLHDKNIKLVLITEPFVLTTSKRWKDACDKNILAVDSTGKPFTYEFYFGNTGLIDIYKANGREWFWDRYRELIKMGVDGFWGDLGEPEVHPQKLLHATGKADELHNRYGHDWARLIHEGYKKEFPSKRPFILMRSGYSGTQRFGIIPWSGDVNRTWGGLKPQPEIALQMGMQGVAYMHSDLGGFAGANDDPELYTRWLQYGVFQPIFRPHAQEEVASEAIYKDAQTKSYVKKAIELRYQLFPYNYSLAVENHLYGWPLMRPYFMAEDDTANYSISNLYCWGDDILVAPVLSKSQKNILVRFPKENRWFDWYNGKTYFGGSKVVFDCDKDKVPFFVKGGAIIPLSKSIKRIGAFSRDSMELNVFFAPEVKQQLKTIYFGEDYDSEKLDFSYSNTDNHLTFQIILNEKCKIRQTAIKVHELDRAPNKVILNGKEIPFSFKKEGNCLHLPVVNLIKGKNQIILD
ncbi:MAG: TIM-barrel domain-containing protein [Bacteroidota bacterium]|jgi:oligosaccharide 4-alpha-D-glucosyltransferase